MHKFSLDQIFGCSTAFRHSIIALPNNRIAFLAGSYLVIHDCLTNQQRYLSFSSIEFLYISSSGLLMCIIERYKYNGDTRIQIYSTMPVRFLCTIEPDRFGRFIGLTINNEDNILIILHSEPAYMITIQKIQIENNVEENQMNVSDLSSVRVVHGPVMNRMTKVEVIPHVAFISFCPYTSNRFCATGPALFKIYEINNQNVQQQIIHFRAEFYVFTCHCWLDQNSILTGTNHGHIFWIQDGSIRSDINLNESITIDLDHLKSKLSNNQLKTSASKILKDELFTVNSHTKLNDSLTVVMKSAEFDTNLPLKSNNSLDKVDPYFDIFTSKEILPYFVVSFQEYILTFISMDSEPFFKLNTRYRLQKNKDNHQVDFDIHNIHKMSYIFDKNSSLIYVLSDRNHIFRFKIIQTHGTIELDEKHIYGFHAYNILSIGLCAHKPWLITLGADNLIKILDYQENGREILSKCIVDDAFAITGCDPYGFHVCVGVNNHFQLYLIANYELRMIHQYDLRNIKDLEISQSGHLIAAITHNLIKIYSTIKFNLISQLRGHTGKIKQVVWCKNDSILISCGTDGMIHTFNILTGIRQNEIITKQYRYMGITVTKDCSRIYAITSDSMLKVYNQVNLEEEWKIENDFIPSAIILSKSESLLYVGMTHGIIRIYSIPFIMNTYIDLSAHCSSVRRLLVSYDDQYLVSIAESAYVLIFKQTKNMLNTFSSQYKFVTITDDKHTETNFQYILVTKSEYDEERRKIQEIQERTSEFEIENDMKLRSKQLAFSKQLNTYSNKFQLTMKDLMIKYQQLKTEILNDRCRFEKTKNDLEDQYEILENRIQAIYENKMIDILTNIKTIQTQINTIENEYNQKRIDFKTKQYIDLTDVVKKINVTLELKWRSSIQDYESNQQNEHQLNEYLKQVEIDIDDYIENVKNNYENQLKFLDNYLTQLNISVGTLRKRYNDIITRMDSRDMERNNIEKEVKDLQNRHLQLTENLIHFRSTIKKKEDRIGLHDMKLHRLQQHILHVEKRKYVLDYKTKSLLERIEPLDQEILRLKLNNESMEQQLTVVERHQNDLISREGQYENKLHQSLKQLNIAKKIHQSIWKTVKEQKDCIKQAFEYTEINCETNEYNRNEQLKTFVQHLCHTIHNEQRTENQLEIEGFMSEWNKQRQWLLNQLYKLTKFTEDDKQTFANIQREHRKSIAPSINQLRELHHLYDDIEKKIQRRLFLLKIKTSEQKQFIKNISEILRSNEKLHLTMNEFYENELYIQLQDSQIDHSNSILSNYQYK